MLSPIAIESTPLEYSGQRVINGFIRPSNAISQGVVIGASGTKPIVALSADNPVRAMVNHKGVLHAVCGGKLWSVSGTTATELADVADGETYMASSGTELGIVANETFYLWSNSTISQPTTGEVTTPRGVAHLNGYFIVSGADSERGDTFSVSDLNDGSTFDGLNFATAENAPDDITGVIADHGQLWLFGTTTTEVWYPSGGADFPFSPNQGASVQQGCKSGQTIAQLDNSLFWVSPENTVLAYSGGSPSVVSTPEIEELIAKATIESGLTVFDKGHLIYAIRRTDDTTLCYDLRTQKWHERAQGALGGLPWSARCSVNVDGSQYVGTAGGKIAMLDVDTYTDDGEVLALEVTTKPITQGGRPLSVGRVLIQVLSGKVSLSYTPQILMQSAEDGKRWSAGKFRSLGRQGEYMSTPNWNGLGQFKHAAWFRFRITDPVQRDIVGVAYE